MTKMADVTQEKAWFRKNLVCSCLILEEFRKPQPLVVSKKVRQYTSNLYGSTPPICIAGPFWLLSLEERETQQYTSHLYCSTPPICTAVLLGKYWGLGSPESSSL